MKRILSLTAATCLAGTGVAQDFRIETKVYSRDRAPVSENVTLFRAGVVYDFLDAPPQIAVFRDGDNDSAGRFVLLDPENRVQTEVSTDRIDSFLTKVREWASTHDDAYLRFTAAPVFQETFDEASGELTLESDILTYRVETTAADAIEPYRLYRDFSNGYAKLNALFQAGLPGPRLRLNESLAHRHLLPAVVHLTIPSRNVRLRAEHGVNQRLSKRDLARIDEVARHLTSFRKISNQEYRSLR